MIKEVIPELYRYDLVNPPTKWDINPKNEEYKSEIMGPKNSAGLYFFTDCYELANDLGRSYKENYYLTTCRPNELKVIDFGRCDTIYHMLCVLKDLNIDVLTENFKTYEEKDGNHINTFLSMRDYFYNAEVETDMINKMGLIQKLRVDPNSDYLHISLFGQRLTDFQNGIIFKELVRNMNSNIDDGVNSMMKEV